jgi:hypothetical protein
VLGLTVFDNVAGFKAKYFPYENKQPRAVQLDQSCLVLDSDVLVLPKSRYELFAVSRQRAEHNTLTSIAVYMSAPIKYAHREGFYCGVGVWFLDRSARGAPVLKVLRKAVRNTYDLMSASSVSKWDVGNLTIQKILAEKLELEEVTQNEEVLVTDGGLDGDKDFEICCVDLSDACDDGPLASILYETQVDPRYGRFSKAFISTGKPIITEIRHKRRAVFFAPNLDGKRLGEIINHAKMEARAVDKGAPLHNNDTQVAFLRQTYETLGALKRDIAERESKIDYKIENLSQELRRIRKYFYIIIFLNCAVILITCLSLVKVFVLSPPVSTEELLSLIQQQAGKEMQLSGLIYGEKQLMPPANFETFLDRQFDARRKGGNGVLNNEGGEQSLTSGFEHASPLQNSKGDQVLRDESGIEDLKALSSEIEKATQSPVAQKNPVLKKVLEQAHDSIRKQIELAGKNSDR